MWVLARETKSRTQSGIWADWSTAVNRGRGRQRGPLFQIKKGHRAKIRDFEGEFVERMVCLKVARPGLFEPGVEIAESCSLFRSLRRVSTTER